jgi:hypothetical protein
VRAMMMTCDVSAPCNGRNAIHTVFTIRIDAKFFTPLSLKGDFFQAGRGRKNYFL